MDTALWIAVILLAIVIIAAAAKGRVSWTVVGVILLLIVVFSRIENYYQFEDSHLDALKQRIATAIPEIKRVKLVGSNESFTIDKKKTYICLKDDKGKYYPDNTLIYVILHELAHALSPTLRHTSSWKSIFKSLLIRAEKGGVYDSKIPIVSNYCGY